MVSLAPIYVGCAGWNLRKESASDFPAEGTHLQRYASRFNCVEINSSFYRPHRPATYQRWAASTPGDFRFSVKLPKEITHVHRLAHVERQIEQFATEVAGLDEKLGIVLVQLPPSLSLDQLTADAFFRALRSHLRCPITCEPRHPTWFTPAADALLQAHAIGRVAADPSVLPAAANPGGFSEHTYFRWHGSPRMYYSHYDDYALQALALCLNDARQTAKTVWCIFDNTAAGAALKNAMTLASFLHQQS